MRHYEIRTFINDKRQVIEARTPVVSLAEMAEAKTRYMVFLPFPCRTPNGPIQLTAEITLDAETSEEAFVVAEVQIPAKFPAAQQAAVREFENQQRAAALASVPALPPGLLTGRS